MIKQIDYRNGKYQGLTNEQSTGSRHGFGILVDDDLSMYASSWSHGKLNGPTVIYISHGKYIYGSWADNEPNGLNVFRIGDTVIIGKFYNGSLKGRVLVIFEKFNFISILEQSKNGQWPVLESGYLKNYNELLKYIEEAQLPMEPHYFSLVKFLTSISTQSVVTVPCRSSENCYFGFQQGLGIVFNPNNGVVSVGTHINKKLCEFGGRYELPNFVIEGNFQNGQVIKYSKLRPKAQIYAIFQKIHKTSLNFKNQYFDSKVKLLTNIEELVRSKIDQIIDNKNENTFTAMQLNDSLDYHPENIEEINRIYKVREEVYQSAHIPMKKATSKYVDESPQIKKTTSPIKNNPAASKKNKSLITNAPASPIIMKKSPSKASLNQNKSRSKIKKPSKSEHIYEPIEPLAQNNTAETKNQISEFTINRSRLQNRQHNDKDKSPIKKKYLIQAEEKNTVNNLVSSKEYVREKQLFNIPTFTFQEAEEAQNQFNNAKGYIEYIKEKKMRKIDSNINRQKDANNYFEQKQGKNMPQFSNIRSNLIPKQKAQCEKSPAKAPKYEDLSERRKRILNSFKDLNSSSTLLSISPTPKNRRQNDRSNNQYEALKKNYDEIDSPCTKFYHDESTPSKAQNHMNSRWNLNQGKQYCQNNEMMPLSIRTYEDDSYRPVFGNIERASEHQSPAHILRAISSNEKTSNNYKHKEYQNFNYQKQIHNKKQYDENYIVGDFGSSEAKNTRKEKAFEKKQSYHEENRSVTPRKKAYKYYFD